MTARQRIGWLFARAARQMVVIGARIADIESDLRVLDDETHTLQRQELLDLGSALLTEMHGTTGCDPNCEARYHGTFRDLPADEFRTVVGPSLTTEQWDAATHGPWYRGNDPEASAHIHALYVGPTGDQAYHYHPQRDPRLVGFGHQHPHSGAHEHSEP